MDCRRGKAREDESDEDPVDYFEAKLYSVTAEDNVWREFRRIYLHEAEYVGSDLVLTLIHCFEPSRPTRNSFINDDIN